MILLHGALGAAEQLAVLSSHFPSDTAHTFDLIGTSAERVPTAVLARKILVPAGS